MLCGTIHIEVIIQKTMTKDSLVIDCILILFLLSSFTNAFSEIQWKIFEKLSQ